MRKKTFQVFICYRRDDSAYAATGIYEKLQQELGDAEVFFDVDKIPPGRDFRTFLQDAVSRCDVLLVMIGIHWVDIPFEEGPWKGRPRLSDPDDYVRIEIASALRRGIPVIPVLLGGAGMPKQESLPTELHELVPKQAIDVRSGKDFARHVEELAAAVKNACEQNASPEDEDARPRMPFKIFLSYSHRDALAADTIANTLRAIGLVPLQDLKELRSGERWDNRLHSLIEEADLFVLLWSSHLRDSRFADIEWRHALSLGREQFIRPVYYEGHLPPPPPELMHLHFGRIPGLPSGGAPTA